MPTSELDEGVDVDHQLGKEVQRRRGRGRAVGVANQLRQAKLPLCV